jgi:hypothetical protein
MLTFAKRMAAAGLVVCGLLALDTSAAHAQYPNRVALWGQRFTPVQNYYPSFVPTRLQRDALRNWAFNTAVIGQTYASIPPWVFGWNPYVPQYVGYWGGYSSGSYGGYSPYYSGGYSNPYGGYSPQGSYGTYGGGNNPYYSNGYGGDYGYLNGGLLNAYGNLNLQQEQARLLREQVEQAKLDTKKKRFDTLAYIRDHTPSWGEQQAKINRQIFFRIQNLASPAEIWSGKSLNVLLQNLKKFADAKLPIAASSIDEDTLKHLNVTAKYGNLGLLRNNGAINWPVALADPDLTSKEERKRIEKETQRLFRQATNDKVDGATLLNLQNKMEEIRELLIKNVNRIPTPQYMEAKRFLNDFDSALRALREGDAAPYFDFQSKFASAPRTADELVRYMAKAGLKFAPATNGDEAAYQAVHDALVGWSVALENLVAAATPRKE